MSGEDDPKDATGAKPGEAELQALAKQYLDLWQDQMSALANDSDFVVAWRKMAEAMGLDPGLGSASASSGAPGDPQALMRAMMAGMAPSASAPGREKERSGDDSDERASGGAQPASVDADSGAATGTPAATAAPERGGHDLDLIARRLALLEERVAQLESQPKAAGKRAGGKARKAKS